MALLYMPISNKTTSLIVDIAVSVDLAAMAGYRYLQIVMRLGLRNWVELLLYTLDQGFHPCQITVPFYTRRFRVFLDNA